MSDLKASETLKMRELGASLPVIEFLFGISEKIGSVPIADHKSDQSAKILGKEVAMMQSALFATFFKAAVNATRSDAFLNAFFHYEKMMQGGVQELSFDDGARLIESLENGALVLSKCMKCSSIIVSKSHGSCPFEACSLLTSPPTQGNSA